MRGLHWKPGLILMFKVRAGDRTTSSIIVFLFLILKNVLSSNFSLSLIQKRERENGRVVAGMRRERGKLKFVCLEIFLSVYTITLHHRSMTNKPILLEISLPLFFLWYWPNIKHQTKIVCLDAIQITSIEKIDCQVLLSISMTSPEAIQQEYYPNIMSKTQHKLKDTQLKCNTWITSVCL